MPTTSVSRARLRAPLWDRIGLGLSGLCALHCLLIPVALMTLPLWPSALHLHEWAHPVFAVLLIPVTLLAMRSARHRRVIGLLGSGLALVLVAFLLHDFIGHTGEAILTLIGSGLLIAGHLKNRR